MSDYDEAAEEADDGMDAEGAPQAAADDGLPGLAIDGYPGLRAGAFADGKGVLGLYRAPTGPIGGGQTPAIGNGFFIQAADHGSSGAPSALPDYITKSWRWNDPEALKYDLDRKQGQRSQAQIMSGIGDVADTLGDVADWVAEPRVQAAAKGLHAFGNIMKKVDPDQIQKQINELQTRQDQLNSRRSRQT